MPAKDTWRPFCVRYVYCSASGLDRGRAGLLLSLLSMFFVRRKAGRQRPAGRLLPSVCCLLNDGVLVSRGNKHLVVVYMLVIVCQFSSMLSNDNSSPARPLSRPEQYTHRTQNGGHGPGVLCRHPGQVSFCQQRSSEKTKSRPLTKAISTRNSTAATRHYLQWHHRKLYYL